MKLKFNQFFYTKIKENNIEEFKCSLLRDNINRIKVFSLVIIVFELIFSIIDLVSSLLKVDGRFLAVNYLIAYVIMILVNVIVYFCISNIGDINNKSDKYINTLINSIFAYYTFLLCWGSVVSLMDQKLYGQLMVFMTNMVLCATLIYIDNKRILFSYVLSAVILIVGLPFFQSSKDVVIGHYVNLIVFVTISYICSRFLFDNYCKDFNNKILLREANKKLYELSYFDELTCIPNRRSLNNYIQVKYNTEIKAGDKISAIMIDIDYFKQYNDNYGHIAGDKTLVIVAEKIDEVVKTNNDFAARIGGEEFVYFAIGKDSKQILAIAEMIREKILNLNITHNFSDYNYLSISLGVSSLEIQTKEDIFNCIKNADSALYDAKICGRNCVKIKQI